MSVDLEPKAEGGRITFGLAEKLIAAAAFAIVGGFGWRFYDGVTEKLDAVVVQQAVTNQRLGDLTVQMADVPALKLEVAKHAVQIEQNKQDNLENQQDIRELKQARGLR